MRRLAAALLLATAGSLTVLPATALAWTAAGPWGGVVHDLVNTPAGGDTLLAGTGNGLYRYSIAAGGSWTLYDQTTGYRVLQVLPSAGGDAVYAVVRPSWEPFDFAETAWSGLLYELDPTTGDFVQIFGMDDPATAGTDETLAVSSLVLCGPGDLLVSTFDEQRWNFSEWLTEGYVYRRPSGGGSWTRILPYDFNNPNWWEEPLSSNWPITALLGSAGSSTVYMLRKFGALDDVVASFNDSACGSTWVQELTDAELANSHNVDAATALGSDPSGDVLLGSDDGVVIKRSVAGTWSGYGTGLPTVHPVVDFGGDLQGRPVAVLRNPDFKGTLVNDPDTGIWRLEAGVWSPAAAYNLVSSQVRAVLPAGGDEWVAYDRAGIWRYPGGALPAQETDRGIAAAGLTGMVIHPRHPDRALAFGPSGVYERRDGIWSRLVMSYIGSIRDNDDPSDAAQRIRNDRYLSADFSHDDDTIWIGGTEAGLLRGTPDLVSGYRFDQVYWSFTGSNETITDILVDPFDSDTVWFTNWSRDGVWRSLDGGATFAPMTTQLNTNSWYDANVIVSDLLEPQWRTLLVGVDTGQSDVPGIICLEGDATFQETDLYDGHPVGGVAFNPADLGQRKAVAGPRMSSDGLAIADSGGAWVLDTQVGSPAGLPPSPVFTGIRIPRGYDLDDRADAFTVSYSNGADPVPGLFHSYADTYQGSPGGQWQEMVGPANLFDPTSVTVHPRDGNLLWVTTRTGSAFTHTGTHFFDQAPPTFPLAGKLEVTNAADVLAGTAGTLDLTWLAPGDDGDMPGWADRYVLHYRTDAAFVDSADLGDPGVVTVTDLPRPHVSHRREKYAMDISAHTDTHFFFALVAYDEQNQASMLMTAATNPAAGDTSEPPTGRGGGGGGGCFIATAASGSALEPDLDRLRGYRDGYLAGRGWGRILIRTYYAVSPRPADCISRRPVLRTGARLLLEPVVAAVKACGPGSALPATVGLAVVISPLICVMMAGLLVVYRRPWRVAFRARRSGSLSGAGKATPRPRDGSGREDTAGSRRTVYDLNC